MQTPTDAIVTREASIEVQASPDQIFALVSDVTRMGEWSLESTGADWVDGGTGQKGDWFDGHNKAGEREWTRACQVACAEPGKDFTFVVGGVEDNCTWWSFEMQPADSGTLLTQRWWIVNKTPAMQQATQEQFEERIAYTQTMLENTVAAIKASAES